MNEQKKFDFLRIAIKPDIKREIDILAAQEQRYVYDLVAEMVEVWKAYKVISVAELPHPADATPVPLVYVSGPPAEGDEP